MSTSYVWITTGQEGITEGADVPAAFMVNVYNPSFSSGGAKVGYQVSGTADGPGGAEVDHNLSDGDMDVSGNPYTAYFSIPMHALSDNLVEGDETVKVDISILSGNAVIAFPPHFSPSPGDTPATASATILDGPPSVRVYHWPGSNQYPNEEDPNRNTSTFEFYRAGGDTSKGLEVRYKILTDDDVPAEGNGPIFAEAGVDYTGLTTRVEFEPGELYAQATFTVFDDAVAEPAEAGGPRFEDVEIELFPTRNYNVAEGGERAKAYIEDGTGWYVEKEWELLHKPDVMRTPIDYVGQYEETTFTGKVIHKYYTYDQYDPFAGVAKSNSFEDWNNDIDMSGASMQFSTAYTWGREFSLTGGVEDGGLSGGAGLTFVEQWTVGKDKGQADTLGTLPVGENEYATAVPLIEARYVRHRAEHWEFVEGFGYHLQHVESTDERIGYTGDLNFAAWKVKRFWLDPDDDLTDNLNVGDGRPPFNYTELIDL